MIHYEVWGRDTFSGEDYFCGSYSNRETAERICAEHEQEAAKHQDADLRDKFSITEISSKEKKERELRKMQTEDEKRIERSYNPDHLKSSIGQLLKHFHDKVQLTNDNITPEIPTGKNYIIITKEGISHNNPDDCFNGLAMELFCMRTSGKQKNRYSYSINAIISFGNSRHYCSGDCSRLISRFDTVAEVLQWLCDKSTPETVFRHYSGLTESFFDD